jgi:hypothetical protein
MFPGGSFGSLKSCKPPGMTHTRPNAVQVDVKDPMQLQGRQALLHWPKWYDFLLKCW